ADCGDGASLRVGQLPADGSLARACARRVRKRDVVVEDDSELNDRKEQQRQNRQCERKFGERLSSLGTKVDCAALVSVHGGLLSVLAVGAGPFSTKGPPTGETGVFLARKNPGDVLDCSADVVREERDGTDPGERDPGETHAVPRHRLALLPPA